MCTSNQSYYDTEIDYLLDQLSTSVKQQKDSCVTTVARSKGCTDVGKYMKERRLRKLDKCQRELKCVAAKKLCDKKMHKKFDEIRSNKLYAESGDMGVTDNTSGIQLISRLKTVDEGATGYAGEHTLSDATIKETTWDLNRIIERPMLVGTWSWNASISGALAVLDTPGEIIKNITLTRSPFEMFQYWRGDITFKLQVVGSPLMSGCMAMSFVPLTSHEELSTMLPNFTVMSVNPTVLGFANANTNAELRVPFNSYFAYLDVHGDEDSYSRSLGYLCLYVVDPLIVVGGTNAVSVSLFATFSDNEFKVPRLSTSTLALQAKWQREYEKDTRKKALRLTAEAGLMSFATEALTGIVSPMLSGLAQSAISTVAGSGNLSKKEIVDAVDSRAMPSNFIGDALDIAGGFLNGALSIFGLDNPTIPTSDCRIIVKSNDSMNYCVGPSYIDKLTINPSSLPLVTPETFATMEDEMCFSYLYRKYTFYKKFTVAVTDATSALVSSWQMHPQAQLTTSTGTFYYMVGSVQQATPLISYLGLPFKYWTGSLNYKFVISASMMHTCKLFVAFQYGEYTTQPANLFDVSSQYGTVIEISQGSNEFEFSVPYVSNLPYLETTTGIMGPGVSMGMINVFVLNPLVAPATVAQSINIMVFVAGGEDFRYEWLSYWNPMVPMILHGAATSDEDKEKSRLRLLNGNLAYSDTYTTSENTSEYAMIYAESGMLSSQTTAPTNNDGVTIEEVNPQTQQVAPPQVPIVVDEHFGLMLGSIRELLKKYQFIGYRSLSLIGGRYYAQVANNLALRVYVAPTSVGVSTEYTYGLLTWASALFRQFKGSLRYKVIAPVGSTIRVYLQPGRNPPLDNDSANLAMGVQNGSGTSVGGDYSFGKTCNMLNITTGSSNVAEFEVPYTMPFLSVKNVQFVDDIYETCNDESYFVLDVTPPFPVVDSYPYTVELYAAFGDEARFGTLYRLPSLFVPGGILKGPPTSVVNTGYGKFGIPAVTRSAVSPTVKLSTR